MARKRYTDEDVQIPMHPELVEALIAVPRNHLTFLVTSYGAPRTAAGFGNWFRDRCNEAGLKHCSAHGLRKSAARRLAEAGCSNEMIKSITGHKTDKEVARYAADADHRRLAARAQEMILRAEGEQNLSNLDNKLDKTGGK